MKEYWKALAVFPVILLLTGGCSATPYTEDSTVTGTIEKIKVEESFLADDEFLVIEGKSSNSGSNSIYEIPVSDSNLYEIGQQVEVVIYSNTNADVWDPDHLKFDIYVIEE